MTTNKIPFYKGKHFSKYLKSLLDSLKGSLVALPGGLIWALCAKAFIEIFPLHAPYIAIGFISSGFCLAFGSGAAFAYHSGLKRQKFVLNTIILATIIALFSAFLSSKNEINTRVLVSIFNYEITVGVAIALCLGLFVAILSKTDAKPSEFQPGCSVILIALLFGTVVGAFFSVSESNLIYLLNGLKTDWFGYGISFAIICGFAWGLSEREEEWI